MKPYLFFFTLLLPTVSCKKENFNSTFNANFASNKTTVYLFEPLEIKAVDTTGNSGYHFDFGDGSSFDGGYKAIHAYAREGTYKVTMSIYGKSVTKEVIVRPGSLSYEIKNSTSRELNILSYIDNYQSASVYRKDYSAGKSSDTLYSRSGGTSALFGGSVFIKNVEYQIVTEPLVFFEKLKHSIFELKDSTIVSPRITSGGSTRQLYYLKDL